MSKQLRRTSIPEPRPREGRARAGSEDLAPIPAEARPLKGHVAPGSQTDGMETFIPFENSRGY
jgi:hypothetical protein